MSTLYDPDLTQWLQLSGEYIGRVRPADERVDWIVFLFEQIKPFISQEEYQKLLAEMQAALAAQQQ
ncbi:hypothetical protein [Caldilinea sp.]|mgnify:CR=1 FL=1|uniref:hypothetical protein n=1 Tax=Caldilinea sp. TaxID=2293560 RepID=UPI002BE86D08|nr:hypothetical protein [Anaerolineales bacterium]HQY91976.1 hypothetical protein [Caldilinea sp.]HRA67684.1 hypothetical protein [Caldilinea sp.]